MTAFSYTTIQAPSEGIYKEKGSKFLAFAYPVTDDAEIKALLKSLKKKYFDARHQGYAYVLGPGKEIFRAVDDGEPNHSTGDPILGQIRSRNLTNVLVVVVRYFGGTKLGIGGLISAYRSAAADALSNAVEVEKEVVIVLALTFEFSATPEIMKLIKDYDLVILKQEFAERTMMRLEVRRRVEEKVREKIALLKAMGSSIDYSSGVGESE